MKKSALIISVFFFSAVVNAQTIFGVWKNINADTGKVDSFIEVYNKDDKAYAKVIEITDVEQRNGLCTECEGTNKNKPILGMDILTGLSAKGNIWSGGEILDPQNGKIYDCTIELKSKDKLKIRGYLGVSLFGRTVYWYRKQ